MKATILPLLTFLSCFLCNFTDIKAQTIYFSYDSAGNQNIRELKCISCEPKHTVDRVASEELTTLSEKSTLRYYPNPVTNELHLDWTLVDNQQLTSITLYAINGQHIRTFSNLEKQTKFQIPFSDYPNGMYSLIILYNNSEKQAYTIIKK
ncbi:T9SS type A sorting domain-containing protein [Flavobacterium sp.]|uniref:T9SS type A sorting domain-containing protein n=1 Tax=Flavobacterium sp. TaxID=239 RepID=UPI002620DB55|nr:T9SS type A sorting domain-containing protein [Flavobacterium sp.]